MNNKESCLCEECTAEIKKMASELTTEQIAIAKVGGMTPEEYVENM